MSGQLGVGRPAREPSEEPEDRGTEQAVTASDGLEVGYAVLVTVYVLVGAAVFWLMRRLASRPPDAELPDRHAGGR